MPIYIFSRLSCILLTTTALSISAYTYPELYPKSLGGNANDIDSFKSGIFYIKIQQPGKSIPVNSGHQLDKKEFYQAIQKYGETSKADASAGNVAQYIVNNQGSITANEAATLSAQLSSDGITASPTGSTCGSLHTAGTLCVLGTGNNLASVDTALYLKGPGQTATTSANAGNFQITCCASSLGISNLFNDNKSLALYRFDNDSNDSNGNYNGTLYGTAGSYSTTSFNGKSLYFASNATSYVRASSFVMNVDNDYTISLWFNTSDTRFLTSTSGQYPALFDYNQLLVVQANSVMGGLDIWNCPNAGGTVVQRSIPYTAFAANTWYNLVIIKNTGVQTVYLNGVLQTLSTRPSGSTVASEQGLLIGQYNNGSNSISAYNGYIDQVRIFNKALSSAEVTALYNEK